MKNFIPINRKIFNNSLWKEERSYSKFEAWVDIIRSASFVEKGKTDMYDFGRGKVTWNRGEWPISITFLAGRWRWTDMKVRSFLKRLEKDKMITKRTAFATTGVTTYPVTVLTVCKYDRYNDQQQGVQQGVQQESKNIPKNIPKEKRELYSRFQEEARSPEYDKFVDFLFGNTDDKVVYGYCLGLPDGQIDYDKYRKLRQAHSMETIADTIRALQTKQPTRYKNFYLVLLKWCKIHDKPRRNN